MAAMVAATVDPVAELRLPRAEDPRARALYAQALLHRSAADRRVLSNERLELLGDAVLSAAVTEYLLLRFPAESEGFLSGLRSRLVRGRTLAAIARGMGLHRHVVCAEGQAVTDDTCEDAFEALVGAVHIAAGYDAARDWTVAAFETHAVVSDLVRDHVSPKEELLRASRSRGVVPNIEVTRVAGGGYKAVVRAANQGGEILGAAEGRDAKTASDAACSGALRHLGLCPAARQRRPPPPPPRHEKKRAAKLSSRSTRPS